MIKAILLDLGNVIVPIDFQRCHAALEALCPYPAQEIPKRMGASGLVQRFEKGQISPEDFVQEACQVLDLKVNEAQFWELWSTIFLPETLIPDSLLEALRRRQRLLLLSNTNVVHFAMVQERYSVLRHFDGYILSYEVGMLKPSPEIYREAVARAGCQPQECFFTDDIPSYVEAARQEGIDAVQFQSLEQFQAELQARGLLG